MRTKKIYTGEYPVPGTVNAWLRYCGESIHCCPASGAPGFRVPVWYLHDQTFTAVERGCLFVRLSQYGSSGEVTYRVATIEAEVALCQVDHPVVMP
jgi:hypothetical protein